ncbi:hypothetical protein ACFX14_043366 [Malus domestica]
MADQSRQTSQKLYESAPVSYRATKFLIAVTIGAALLVLSCLTLTRDSDGPDHGHTSSTSGFVLSSVCGMVAVTPFWWLYTYTYNYVAAKQRAHGFGQFTILGV